MSPEQRDLIRQILRLVDLSGDLLRNQNDNEHIRQHGSIIYVFDENVFEMFVRPSRGRQQVETFYSKIWENNKRDLDEWRSFEAQAAVITSEYLLSGVRNSADDNIYLTDPHLGEFARRMDRMASDLRSEIAEDGEGATKKFETKLSILSDLETGVVSRTHDLIADIDGGSVPRDVRAFFNDATNETLNRFKLARVVAYFLAHDPVISPLEQLSRLVSPEFRSRIRSIRTLFNPGPQDRDLISVDAGRWERRLVQELQSPIHSYRARAREGSESQRDRALRNDAESLAYLRWASEQARKSSIRLVFITGDYVLFDAYRRWYNKDRDRIDSRDPSQYSDRYFREQFFVRRVTQFTPIFNPQDTLGDLSVSERQRGRRTLLFDLIQQVVETIIVPVSLASKAEWAPDNDPLLYSKREALSLIPIEPPEELGDSELGNLIAMMPYDWLQHAARQIDVITERWQEAERLSIGASIELLTSRWSKDMRTEAQEFISKGERDASELMTRSITSVLDSLVEASLQFWKPLAGIFAQEVDDSECDQIGLCRRFTLAVLFARRPGDTWFADASEFIESELVFAKATCRAIELQDANNAIKFASLALSANEIRRERAAGGVVTASHRDAAVAAEFEIKYLYAVALKFGISSVNSHLREGSGGYADNSAVSRGTDAVLTYYFRARNLVLECIAFHKKNMDFGESDNRESHKVRYFRSLSERASLHLFISTSLGLAVDYVRDIYQDKIQEYLEIAREDLWNCIKFDSKIDPESTIYQSVKFQYLSNLAGYDVINYLIKDGKDYRMQNWPARNVRDIYRIWRNAEHIHLLLNREFLAFAALKELETESFTPIRSEIIVKAASREMTKRLTEVNALRYPLDRHLYRSIRDNIDIGLLVTRSRASGH